MKRRLFALCALAVALSLPASATAGPSPHMFEELIRDIQAIDDPNTRPLLASAEAAQAAFARGNHEASCGALGALENKLGAQLGIDNPNIRPVLMDIAVITDAFIDDPNIKPNCIDDPNA